MAALDKNRIRGYGSDGSKVGGKAVDQERIQGFGSDGVSKKVWHCPKGHHLQPRKATAGKCDGCKHYVAAGEQVMDCRQCNWYLCTECHPQEQEGDWFWGSVNLFWETAQKEMEEITEEFKEMAGEVETFMSDFGTDFGFASTCGVVNASPCKDEVRFDAPEKPKAKAKAKAAAGGGEKKQQKQRISAQDQAAQQQRRQQRQKEKEAEEAEAEAQRAQEKAAAPAEAAAAAPAKPKPVEDLIDIGQPDLLDLDAEPLAFGDFAGAELAAPAAVAPAAPAPAPAPAAAAPAAGGDLDFLMFDEPAGAPAAGAEKPAAPAPAAAAPDLLDF